MKLKEYAVKIIICLLTIERLVYCKFKQKCLMFKIKGLCLSLCQMWSEILKVKLMSNVECNSEVKVFKKWGGQYPNCGV